MRMLRAALLLAILCLPGATLAEFSNFITADGARLMDGEKPFRFIAFNVPTLLYVEDEMAFDNANPYGLPSEFELRDLYRTVVEMGGQVVRAYTIPVRNDNFPEQSITYVEAPGKFNEQAFAAMDLAIALAEEHGIRVVVPLVNNWQWMGGRPNYAAFRGKESDAFWTDRELIEDFKKTIEFVLNRRNTVSGKLYKDDKTILAWETGNELQNTAEWAIEIGDYIKSIDSNHLLIDGFHAIHMDDIDVWVQQYSLDEPSFDLVNTHHYETSPIATVENLRKTVEMVDGQKPVFLGEFGFISTSGFEAVLDYVIGEQRIPGALVWSLRRHHRNGGFYHHSEPLGFGRYRAYHWPGFRDGDSYDETRVLELIRAKAFAIQGREAPPVAVPDAPVLLPFERAPEFSWRGSMGASGYDIERKAADGGGWVRIAHDIDDIDTPGFPLFSDESAEIGESYSYRVIAHNRSGRSEPSNVVGPVVIDHLVRTDRARNVGALHESQGVEVRSGEYRTYKEAFSRLHGAEDGHIVYRSPGPIVAVRFYVFESDLDPDLAFYESVDGINWSAASASSENYASNEANYDYLVPTYYSYAPEDPAIRFVRAEFGGEIDIVRVELAHR